MKLLVLAGGTGTRLWPVSRIYNPKQFVKFKGMGYSTFQKTILSAVKSFEKEEIFIVSNKEYKYFILGQLKELNIDIPNENIILEPSFKNTLHAVSLGVYYIKNNDNSNSNILIIPANNVLDNYCDIINMAEVKQNSDSKECDVVLFGIHSSKKIEGYTYLIKGDNKGKLVRHDDSALKNIFLQNTGIILVSSNIFISVIAKYYPEIHKLMENEEYLKAYELDYSNTIEYGILEKLDNIHVVELSKDIININEFSSFYSQYNEKIDSNGNILFDDDTIFIESSNNLIYTESNKAIGCIGIKDVVVIDQPDALLVCHKDKTSQVKYVAEILRSKNDERAEIHTTAYRPWGSYTVLEEGESYKIKRLTVLPGKKLSYQMHYHRSEHWVVVNGTGLIVKEDAEHIVRSGESIYISSGEKHRLENRGKTLLEVIEVQIGSYLGEDDIVRFEDDYGRGK